MSNPLAQQQARECLRTSILPERVRDFADLAPLLAAPLADLPFLPGAYVADCLAFANDRSEDARRLLGETPCGTAPQLAEALPGDCWAVPLARSLLRMGCDVRTRVREAFQLNEQEAANV